MICAAAGALPDTTRDFSTVIAESPPPPATAKSFQVWPFCIVAFSSAAAFGLAARGPPVQHLDFAGAGDGQRRSEQAAAASDREMRVMDMRLPGSGLGRFSLLNQAPRDAAKRPS